MLRYTASFQVRNMCLANNVKQRCFAMVHMPHNRHHGRSPHQGVGIILFNLDQLVFLKSRFLHFVIKLCRDKTCRLVVDALVNRRHDALTHQHFYDFTGFYSHPFRQL